MLLYLVIGIIHFDNLSHERVVAGILKKEITMIIDTVRGDVFRTALRHIAFAVNTNGYNGAGFAGLVASRHWPELADTGVKKLGSVMSRSVGEKTFYALVCHTLNRSGWKKTPEIVAQCLDSLDIPDGEPIAVVLMGSGRVGQMGGADVFAILGGLARSNQKIIVYTKE